MTRARDRRLDKIAALKLAKRPIPCILRVPFGRTIAEARAAFDAEYEPKPGFAVLTVPAKPRTEAEHEMWAERFFANQSRLVADARRVAVPNVAASETRSSFPQRAVAPPRGRAFMPWTRNK